MFGILCNYKDDTIECEVRSYLWLQTTVGRLVQELIMWKWVSMHHMLRPTCCRCQCDIPSFERLDSVICSRGGKDCDSGRGEDEVVEQIVVMGEEKMRLLDRFW